jgi:SEC-C motif
MADHNRPGRNDKCPCGSGLKYKHCHGDPEKANACIHLSQLYLMKLIAGARYRAGLIQRDDLEEITSRAEQDMLDIIGMVEVEEPDDAPKVPVSAGLVRCPSCGAMTYGECVKCKKGKTNEQREQSGPDDAAV